MLNFPLHRFMVIKLAGLKSFSSDEIVDQSNKHTWSMIVDQHALLGLVYVPS